MNRRFGKLLLVFTVLGLLFAAALFLFRTHLVAYGLTLLLEKEGAKQVSVTVERVAAGGVNFEQLDFILRRGSRLLDLQIKNLTISFKASELLHGQLQEIALENLTVQQSVVAGRAAAKPSAPFDLPHLLTQLSGDWHQRLPFRKATIADLRLSGPDLPPALVQPLKLAMIRTDSGVKVDCRPIAPTGSADVRLALEKDIDTLSITAAAAEAGQLSATLATERLDGSFSLDPARLNSLLVLFGANTVQGFDQIDSTRLNGSFTVKLNRWPLLDMQAQLVAKSLTLSKTTLKGLDLELSLKSIDFENLRRPLQAGHLRLVVDQLSRADFSVAGIEAQLEVTAGGNGNYRLGDASTFTMAEFKAADTSFHEATLPLNGTLSLTQNRLFQLQLNGTEQWQLTELRSAGISIEKAALRPAVNVYLTRESARIDCTTALRVKIERLAVGDLQIPSLALQPSNSSQIQIDRSEELQWTLQDSRWRINLPLAKNPRMQLRPDEISLSLTELSGKGRSASLSGSAHSERIAIAAASRKTYGRNVALDFSLSSKEVKGKGDFFVGPYQQPLSFKMQHKLTSSRGTFQLTTPSPLELSEQQPLSRAVDPWDFPGDAESGRIGLTLTANWGPERAATAVADIGLKEIGGRWRNVAFSGLSLRHRLQLWPLVESLDQALLTVDLIAFGVPITETRAALQLRQAGQTLEAPLSVELEQGNFTLLGSVFSLKPFTYQSDTAENRIRIDTAKLDLAQLTPLFKTQGLQLTGLAAATLPLELGTEGVEMVDGSIRQKGPGVITYRPQDREMLKRAGLPDIVIKALADFHYDQLEVDAAYQPNGQLDLAVRLQGKSPTAGTDRPIHLNLNIEQNLLSLLKSLRYSGTFDRKIEKYMEQKR